MRPDEFPPDEFPPGVKSQVRHWRGKREVVLYVSSVDGFAGFIECIDWAEANGCDPRETMMRFENEALERVEVAS